MGNHVLIATGNPDKFREIRDILKGLPLKLYSLQDVGLSSPPETGLTLQENAWIKAWHGFQATGLPTLDEDTGLVVPALHGMPGVFSARFAGEGATYAQNREKLLRLLASQSDRRAAFVSVVAFVDGHIRRFFEGRVEGWIAREERGSGGFGYDPVFIYPPWGQSFAEIPLAWKNRISHRFQAWRQVRAFLAARTPTETLSDKH